MFAGTCERRRERHRQLARGVHVAEQQRGDRVAVLLARVPGLEDAGRGTYEVYDLVESDPDLETRLAAISDSHMKDQIAAMEVFNEEQIRLA